MMLVLDVRSVEELEACTERPDAVESTGLRLALLEESSECMSSDAPVGDPPYCARKLAKSNARPSGGVFNATTPFGAMDGTSLGYVCVLLTRYGKPT